LLRDLLCGHCNKGIGHFDDDVQWLERAIAYILMPGFRS
jgi:Recombination endonuclease VII